MFQQITKGIEISVKTRYSGTKYRDYIIYYSFSYFISIKNTSARSVKLLERFWVVFDSLNNTQYINGMGVVGHTPIINPKEVYKYQSYCYLISSVGVMNGKYKMLEINTNKEFFVSIPTLQLISNPKLN
ncbi:MAG: Co2+/Mg2+ efflux protein ApaG [Tenacibaculum sp.]